MAGKQSVTFTMRGEGMTTQSPWEHWRNAHATISNVISSLSLPESNAISFTLPSKRGTVAQTKFLKACLSRVPSERYITAKYNLLM